MPKTVARGKRHSLVPAALSALAIVLCPLAASAQAKSSLVVGVMPAADAAPFFLADKLGYFREAGLDLRLSVFTNPMDRQVALQTGSIDGAITDLVACAYALQAGFDLKIDRSTDGSFPFLLRPGYEEGREVSVGVMEVSVTNYLADARLGDSYRLKKVFITDIAARLEMVRQGKVDMACIPEPLASAGEAGGLRKLRSATSDEEPPDILVFTGKAAKAKAAEIRAFDAAVDRAVADIARDPGLARDVLVERLKLDPIVRDLMDLPAYLPRRLPGAARLAKVGAWVAALQGKPLAVDWSAALMAPSPR